MTCVKKIILGFLDIIEFFVSTAAIAILIYLFITQPHQVDGNSMLPNFHDGEFLLTDKLSYRLNVPERGDVIVFSAPPTAHCPAGLNCDFIKRVIGLPGETISVKNGHVWINGEVTNEPYLNYAPITHGGTTSGSFLPEGKDMIIPDDKYVVLGDNRLASSDSREWGTINRNDIVGKAWLRYWPPNVAGVLASESASQ